MTTDVITYPDACNIQLFVDVNGDSTTTRLIVSQKRKQQIQRRSNIAGRQCVLIGNQYLRTHVV